MSQQAQPPDPEVDPTLRLSGLDFPVVGIGASAGGLAALARFLEGMPGEPGMAIVIVMHLSPRHDSIVDRILQRSTSMPVTQVVEALPLQKNHVYVISPRHGLSMSDGYLRLFDMERPSGKHVSIDFFFRTLAEVHRERAFAVILSGTGSDGSVGIARIRERGGITLVQDPEDAEYDQMPRAAIATGAVDVILPVAELPERIVAMARDASQIVFPKRARSSARPRHPAWTNRRSSPKPASMKTPCGTSCSSCARRPATTSAHTSGPPCFAASSDACRSTACRRSRGTAISSMSMPTSGRPC